MFVVRMSIAVVVLLALTATVSQASLADRGVVVFSSDCSHDGNQHNYSYGTKSYNDRLLFDDVVSLKSKFLRVNTIDVTYPKQGNTPQGTISYIEVTDKRKDSTGGCVYIQDGGVGQNRVTFHFKTQRNHGLDFQVKIYGK